MGVGIEKNLMKEQCSQMVLIKGVGFFSVPGDREREMYVISKKVQGRAE